MTKSARIILRQLTRTSIPTSSITRAVVLSANESSSYATAGAGLSWQVQGPRYSSSATTVSVNNYQLLRRQHHSCGLQCILPNQKVGGGILSSSSTTKITSINFAYATTRRQTFHSSTSVYHLVHKDAEAAKPTEEELAETEDTIPVWQNPRHHNNPEMQKIFKEDFEEGEEMPVIPMPPLETDPDKAVAPPHIHELAHRIVHLNLLELKELTNKISDHFEFDDEMMAANYGGDGGGGGGAGGGTGSEEEVVEEKKIFDLKLVGFDAKAKIKVIKEVRAIGGLGLKEAKELVEGAPKVIQKDLKQDRADELKAQLEAVGAQVEIV